MNANLITILAFGAGVTVVAGIYSIASDIFLRDRQRVNDRMDEEFRHKQRIRVQKSTLFKDLGSLAAAASADHDAVPSRRQRFETLIEQSGLDVTPQKLIVISLVVAAVLFILSVLLGQKLIVAGILASCGAFIPLLYVKFKRKERLEKLLSQLPDTFDLMGRVIRAGQTMSQALHAVSTEFPEPIASEFGYCFEQQNLGLPTELAMRDLARRTGVVEIQIFVMALLIQQQTGGNLAEMLDKLSVIIRTRYKIRGQVKALTAEGRMQAAVLLGLPPALFLIMLFMNRNYASTLFEYPGLIGGTLACEGLGAVWIRKIVNFDF